MAAGQQGSDGQRESTVWEPEPGFLPPETPPNASLKKITQCLLPAAGQKLPLLRMVLVGLLLNVGCAAKAPPLPCTSSAVAAQAQPLHSLCGSGAAFVLHFHYLRGCWRRLH